MMCFFFFKQKTAYEMRISDWSSDVCSSDLFHALEGVANQFARSLRDLIRALGAPTIQIERAGAEQMSFADWSASAAPAIFWRYHAPPLKEIGRASCRERVFQSV